MAAAEGVCPVTIRRLFLSTTMLSGVVGAVFLSAPAADAADYSPLNAPAVDGVNSKTEVYGGSLANKSLYGVNGAIGIPLGGQLGAQIDGKSGSLDQRAFGAIAGHLFWRNPFTGLLGVWASYTNWNEFGGVHVSQVGGEAGYYFGRFTLQAVAGAEWGNSAANVTSIITSSTSIGTSIVPPGGPNLPPGTTTTTTTATTTLSNFIDSYDIRTRFFDQINLKYNFTPDWDGYVGHRYLGGKNALALGTEMALPLGRGAMGALFVEGRIGQGDFHGVWGGIKIYLGRRDKPLIARHRQDDPPIWDSLFSILNNHNTAITGASTSSSTSTSSQFCGPGQHIGPKTGNCELATSDRRLKRDIVLIDRLANGIGIYRYRYLWSDTVYVGVMAQEVAMINPRAVVRGSDGFLGVNYAALGLRLLTLPQWQAGIGIGARALAA